METLGEVTLAAVQTSPVYLDREATVAKACDLIGDAAARGADIVAFPESFVPGYPYWNWMMTPYEGSAWFKRMWHAAVEVPSADTNQIAAAARDHGVYVVLGINERNRTHVGTIYNTNLVFDPDGRLIGRHRKLVPTWAEKLIWTPGDGSGLVAHPTKFGKLGSLICGENTNTLARYSLLAQGELIHVANYPAWPFVDKFNMPQGIQIRAGAHSFEGKLFTVVSCSTISEEIVQMLARNEEEAQQLRCGPSAYSGVFGPDGLPVGESLIDDEGIVVTTVDLDSCIEPRQLHNIVGHYNRFDVFDLTVDRRHHEAMRVVPEDGRGGERLRGADRLQGSDLPNYGVDDGDDRAAGSE